MPPSTGSIDYLAIFASRGIDLTHLGAAYLVLLASVALTAAAFVAARNWLVISPNRWSRDYGIYVSLVLATLLIAVVLENETLPRGAAMLHYVAIPQLLLLLAAHLAIWYRQEPWIVELGAAAIAATIVVAAFSSLTGDWVRPAYWVTTLIAISLLVFLWRKSVSTKRGFLTASSIYISSKETPNGTAAPQKPWLGLTQWVALALASIAVATCNALLRGGRLTDIPAMSVAAETGILMLVTMLVCAVPAIGYWVARKTWMPELTRFVWLAWIVVGFALTYGNYLNHLNRA